MEFLYAGPGDAAVTLLLAPGAGGPMDSPWLNSFCDAVGERGIRTARFEFGYMAARRTGGRGAQPRAEGVMGEYLDAVASVERRSALLIGGKSFGGRVASMIADEVTDARGLVCLGYPFHPPGKPQQPRTAHLLELTTQTLICQGTRDPFGTAAEVSGYGLPPSIRIHWLEDGEHDFRPRLKVSGRTFAQNLAEAADAVASFAKQVA